MARYARLKELGFDTDDSELFEVRELDVDHADKLRGGGDAKPGGHSAEAERAQQQQQQQKSIRDQVYTVPSTELTTEVFSKLQNSKKNYADRQQQNIENGNPNVCPADSTAQPIAVAICSHSCTTATGASVREHPQPQGGGGIGKGGVPSSIRWVGRKSEERSGALRNMECADPYHRDNSSGILDDVNLNSGPTCGQFLSSHRRNREAAARDHHQSQEPFSCRVRSSTQLPHHSQPHGEKQLCANHSSSCNAVRGISQRTSRESSLLLEGHFNAPPMIPAPDKRPLHSGAGIQRPRSDASSCGSATGEEGEPIFQRSTSAREAPGLQRNRSTGQQQQRCEPPSTENINWRDHPASKSVHASDRTTKPRVSFTLTENHDAESQKLREKFREPVTPSKNVLQAKQQQEQQREEQQQSTTNKQQPTLRYNYEQPGFVEREKENFCAGKAYTIYGVKDAKSDSCPKESSGRHHQLIRAFSLREKNGSSYTKMPRAYSVSAGGRHLMPMECETCGKGGFGVVFLGLPGDDADSRKACSCGESKAPKKKKSIMAYCRKILRLPSKPR